MLFFESSFTLATNWVKTRFHIALKHAGLEEPLPGVRITFADVAPKHAVRIACP